MAMRVVSSVAVGLLFVAVAHAAPVQVDPATCLVRPKQIIQLGSSVFGVLAQLMVDRSDVVTQGQVVAKLDTSVEEAQVAIDHHRAANTTQIDAAVVDLEWNKRELARRRQLAGNMFSKANDIDEYVTKVEQDRIAIDKARSDKKAAELETIRSERQLALKVIRSPVNGVITELKLSPGEFIYETTPIMTIAQLDPLTVDLVVPAERYRSVRPGMIAELQLGSPIEAKLPAKVDAVDPVIDPASGTFRVRLVLPNPGNTIPAGVRCSAVLPDPDAS